MDRSALVLHIPGLRRYARALTGNAWAADDLVQDTLERACSKWRLWLLGTDLRAWLFTLMHNIHANDIRRVVRQQQVAPVVDTEDALHSVAAPHSGVDTAMDLQRCLMQLPEEQRCVLLLVALEDMDYADVARITGTPVGTVMSRLSRGRARLQALLDAPPTNPATPPATAAVVNLRAVR